MPAEEDGLDGDGLVAQNPRPVRREGGHMVRVRVQLMLEEYGEVTFCHVSQEDLTCQGAWCASIHVVLAFLVEPPDLYSAAGRHIPCMLYCTTWRYC